MNDFNIGSIIVNFVIIGSIVFMIFLVFEDYYENWGKKKFYKLLTVKLKKGLISDKEDILLLLNSVCREYGKDYSIASIPEDYLTYMTDKKENILEKNYSLIKEIIKVESTEKPFANIPVEERRLLRNIDDSVKHNDLASIKHNLQELSSVISTINRIYQRTSKINQWSIPIAIIGIILTIIFGLTNLL